MSEHYYSQNPETHSKEEQIRVQLRGQSLKMYTDRGVFSKGGIDFGTKLLLDTLTLSQHAKVLDVGCGYGPIGLSIAKECGTRTVTMCDVNQRALALCQKNAQENQIENVTILESDLFARITEQDYDCILTNPPIRAGKRVVHQLLEQSYDYLVKGGHLWVVIQKKQGAPSAFAKLEDIFDEVEEVAKKKGYRIIRAKKGD